MAHIKRIDLTRDVKAHEDAYREAIEKVCRETAFSGGKYADAFDKEFAAYVGSKYASGVNNGTSALHLAMLALVENLQRRDLDYIEEAEGLQKLMQQYHLSQEQAARRIGKSQSAVANKLRLLQLTADQRQFVLDNNLTERHARAVLRLPENRRSEALITIAKRRLNARQTDSYIEQLLNSPPKAGHRISMVRDVRIFVNTIDHAIRLMTDNGVPATAHREEKDGYIEYTVRIPTAAAEK